MSKNKKPAQDVEETGEDPNWRKRTYDTYTGGLNKLAKDPRNKDQVQALLKRFCNDYIPLGCRTLKVEWAIDPVEDNLDGRVLLFAHSDKQKRALGIVSKQEDGNLAPYLCYKIRAQTVVLKSYVVDKPKRQKRFYKTLKHGPKQPFWLITEKRGFYAYWLPSFHANITVHNMEQHMPTLIEWYEKYVSGMEQEPSDKTPRKHDDFEFEQFIMDKYPTPEWRAINKDFKRNHEKKHVIFIDDPHSGEDAPPPPPPPPQPASSARMRHESLSSDEEVSISSADLNTPDIQKLQALMSKNAVMDSHIETPHGIDDEGNLVFVDDLTILKI